MLLYLKKVCIGILRVFIYIEVYEVCILRKWKISTLTGTP